MEKSFRLTIYFFLCGVLLLLTVIHMFRIFSFPTDKMSYFLISLLVVVLLLPLVRAVRFFDIVYVEPRKSVLKKK